MNTIHDAVTSIKYVFHYTEYYYFMSKLHDSRVPEEFQKGLEKGLKSEFPNANVDVLVKLHEVEYFYPQTQFTMNYESFSESKDEIDTNAGSAINETIESVIFVMGGNRGSKENGKLSQC